MTLIRLTEGNKGNENADVRTPTFAAFVIFRSRSVRAKPGRDQIFGATRNDQFLRGGTERREGE
jgi:hypothetical protein